MARTIVFAADDSALIEPRGTNPTTGVGLTQPTGFMALAALVVSAQLGADLVAAVRVAQQRVVGLPAGFVALAAAVVTALSKNLANLVAVQW